MDGRLNVSGVFPSERRMSSISTAVIALVALTFLPQSRPTAATVLEPDACSLLTEDQVSAAIEAKSQPGQRLFASDPKHCIWSDDPQHGVDHRRVTVDIMPLQSFTVGKSVPQYKTEPVSGVGDEAYYIIYKADAPELVVRKGNSVFGVRLLNGFKAKPLTIDESKARDLTLAKAAAAKI
jgi:hypothetical protein